MGFPLGLTAAVLAAMKKGMGRRAFRRAVSDAAMGLVGPLLAYKTARYGGDLIVADRWFASSQIHHGHTLPDGTPCRLVGNGKVDKQVVCPHTGALVDRDINAARNLRDWPDHASCGPVRATAPSVPGPTSSVGTGHGADAGSSGAGGASVRPRPAGPEAERLEPNRRQRRGGTPQGDAA
jgi:putative transposase